MVKPQTIAQLDIFSQTDTGELTVVTLGTHAAQGSKLIYYRLDWGDGTGEEGTIPLDTLHHAYEFGGNYIVSLVVKDSKGRSAQDGLQVMMIVRNPPPPPPPTGRLMQRANLVYLGAFRFPLIEGYSFYTRGLAYNQSNNSLFTSGGYNSIPAPDQEKESEISIPGVISQDMNNLSVASIIQSPADATEGNNYFIGANGSNLLPSGVTVHRGGLHVYNGKLIGTTYVDYDAAVPPSGQLTHWTSGLNLAATGDFNGNYLVGSLPAAFAAGYMCDIPVEWQARLGGPCLTGQGLVAVVSRGSYGPSINVFNPDNLTGPAASSFPATPLVYYDSAHQTLGRWDNDFPDIPNPVPNIYFNAACMQGGIAFPVGTDSVLVFGNIGYGQPGYGIQTTDISLNFTLVPGSNPPAYYIYDLYSNAHATHSWPYHNQIWAYNANDMYQVKQGIKNPWDVIPYALWDLNDILPIHDGYPSSLPSFGAGLVGAAYDSNTQRIFVVQGDGAEHWVPGFGAFSYNPLIRVFQVVM